MGIDILIRIGILTGYLTVAEGRTHASGDRPAHQDVSKDRRPDRDVRANDGITLSADAGQVYGLLGHNGAGKTTLVNQVVGLLRPDAGRILIDGRDVVADPGFARQACSLQPQAQLPINGLTPRQAIELLGQLRGDRASAVRRRPRASSSTALDIGSWQDTDGEKLSGGVKRLVSFAMAAVVPGRIVVLDEPTNDVDPVRRRLLWTAVRRSRGRGQHRPARDSQRRRGRARGRPPRGPRRWTGRGRGHARRAEVRARCTSCVSS